MGWGKFSNAHSNRSENLEYVWLQSRSVGECKERIKRMNTKHYFGEANICTWSKGKDTCLGDSGGPLLKKSGDFLVLLGVVSWGPTTCADAFAPGVYMDNRKFLPWISKITGLTYQNYLEKGLVTSTQMTTFTRILNTHTTAQKTSSVKISTTTSTQQATTSGKQRTLVNMTLLFLHFILILIL